MGGDYVADLRPSSFRQHAKVVSHIEAIKLRLAEARAHPGSSASVDGEEDKPRHTDAQVTELGHRGLAFKKKDGTYSYPVKDRRNLLSAIKAWKLGRVAKGEAAAVKAFIKLRAHVMGLERELPEAWRSKAALTPVDGH
jgi:hypothetical protein